MAVWLAVLVAGALASAHLSGRLSGQFALPSAASYQANQQILRLYGNGGDGYPEVGVVTLPRGEAAGSAAGRAALGRASGAVAAIGGLRVAGCASTGDRQPTVSAHLQVLAEVRFVLAEPGARPPTTGSATRAGTGSHRRRHRDGPARPAQPAPVIAAQPQAAPQ